MKRKKKIRRSKKRRVEGIISILLCLILVPTVTLSAALIEYSRYQADYQTTQEVCDVSNTSALSHYDKYVNDRFGLLSVDQSKKVNDLYADYIRDNMKVMGSSIDLNGVKTKSIFPLSNTGILKQQINDFGETTALSNMLLKDFNLEDLLKKLDNLSFFDKLQSTTGKFNKVAKSIENIINKVDDLKKSINNLTATIKNVEKKYNALKRDIKDLIDTLNKDKKIKIDQKTWTIKLKKKKFDSKEEEEQAVRDYLINKYDQRIRTIVSDLFSLKADLTGNTIKKAAENVVSAYDKLIQAFKDASDAIKAAKKTDGSNDVLNSSEGESSDLYETAVNEIKDSISKSAENLKKKLKKTIDDGINNCVNEINNQFKSKLVAYGFANMTPEEKVNFILDLLEGKISIQKLNPANIISKKNLDDIVSSIEKALTKFKKAVVKGFTSGITDFFKSLLNTVKNMFNLNVGYDGNLCAVLSNKVVSELGKEADNPYVEFLNALSKLMDAGDTFLSALSGISWKKALDLAKAIVKACDACASFWTALGKLANQCIKNIMRLAKYATGNVGDLYNDLLLYAYAAHNFPNKLDYSTGKSLTGFNFGDIKYGKDIGSGNPSFISSFLGLGKTINSLKSKGGSDDMFYGAEMEYLISGTKSEVANQLIVFMNIYTLRLVVDLIPIAKDQDLRDLGLAIPKIATVIVYALVIVVEPFIDSVIITNGGETKMIKGDVYLSPSGIADLVKDLGDVAINNAKMKKALTNAVDSKLEKTTKKYKKANTSSNGLFPMDYPAHCFFILFFSTDPNNLLTRIKNIIHLESKKYYKSDGKSFDIKKAYTTLRSETNVNFNPFMDVFSFKGSIFNRSIIVKRGY